MFFMSTKSTRGYLKMGSGCREICPICCPIPAPPPLFRQLWGCRWLMAARHNYLPRISCGLRQRGTHFQHPRPAQKNARPASLHPSRLVSAWSGGRKDCNWESATQTVAHVSRGALPFLARKHALRLFPARRRCDVDASERRWRGCDKRSCPVWQQCRKHTHSWFVQPWTERSSFVFIWTPEPVLEDLLAAKTSPRSVLGTSGAFVFSPFGWTLFVLQPKV